MFNEELIAEMYKKRDSFIALKEDPAFKLLMEWLDSNVKSNKESLIFCDMGLVGAYRVRADAFNDVLRIVKDITEYTEEYDGEEEDY